MLYYNIGKLIKEDGTSYRALATKVGISYSTLANLATAKKQTDLEVSTVIINKICKYFKVQPADLMIYKKK